MPGEDHIGDLGGVPVRAAIPDEDGRTLRAREDRLRLADAAKPAGGVPERVGDPKASARIPDQGIGTERPSDPRPLEDGANVKVDPTRDHGGRHLVALE